MEPLSPNILSRAALHHAVPLPKGHKPRPRRAKPGRAGRFFMGILRMVGVAPPASVDISLSTVALNSSFDAYIYVSFAGSPPDTNVSLLLDSGNTVLVVPTLGGHSGYTQLASAIHFIGPGKRAVGMSRQCGSRSDTACHGYWRAVYNRGLHLPCLHGRFWIRRGAYRKFWSRLHPALECQWVEYSG